MTYTITYDLIFDTELLFLGDDVLAMLTVLTWG